MTSAQEAPVAASTAKVHEFAIDLFVHRRHAPADGVVALDLVDPQGGDLPAWEPGAHIDLLLADGLVRQYSLCGDPRDPKTWRVGVLLDPQSRGGSRHVHENLAEGSTVRVRGDEEGQRAAHPGGVAPEPARSVALLGLAAVLLFGFIDTNYLKQERAFRRLFNAVAGGPDLPPFCMNPAQVPRAPDAAGHRICRTYRRIRRSVLLSWAIAPCISGSSASVY
jgi:hypothetical protein